VCGVVRGDIDTCAEAVNYRRVGGNRTPAAKSQNHTFDQARAVMNTVADQWLWKWTLMAGVLTLVLSAIVLVWPGPTILVASTLFGVYLLVSGLTLPRLAATQVMLLISGALSVVFPSLRRRLRGAAAVAVDRNRIHLPRRPGVAAGICLVFIGITQIVQALQTRKHAKTAQRTIDEISNRPPALAIHSPRSETAMTMKGRR
jgi:hypothetical protein